jgi:hypothetical protein
VSPGTEPAGQGSATLPGWPRILTHGVGSAAALLVLFPGPLALLSAFPLLLAFRRYGVRQGLAACLVGLVATPVLAPVVSLLSGLLLGAAGEASEGLGNVEVALVYLAVAPLPAGLLELGFQRTRTAARALELACLGYLVLGTAALVAASLSVEGGTGELVRGWIDRSLQRLGEASGQSALASDELATVEDRLEFVRRWGPRLFPSVFASFAILGLWMNVVYLRWFTAAEKEKEDDDLTTWRLPMWVMYALMACIAAVVLQLTFGESLQGLGLFAEVSWNGLLLLGVLYWLQGVAALNHWFLRLKLSPILRMFGLAFQALVMVTSATSVLFGVLGLTDAWFDLRKLEEPGDPSGEER